MIKAEDPIKKAFDTIKVESPTKEQKNKILNNILKDESIDEIKSSSLLSLIVNYPWRFAFGFSVIQTIICTLVFGSKYTDIFLNMIRR